MKILVTGGAGFIGSNLIRLIIQQTNHSVVNADKLTYAGNLASLREVESNPRYQFEWVDITEPKPVERLFEEHQPDSVMHLAAESHVDRSMDGPDDFIQTNIVGTFTLLHAAKAYYDQLTDAAKSRFRFLHVSTDEVFGSLDLNTPAFSESTPYDPHSPYSASKAASDHLVRVWHHTYGLPILITNCSNNYGPYQFPEKLIPVVILKAIRGEAIPIYGNGENIRDWLFVDDHARALMQVLDSGKTGSTYNIGSNNEWTNIDLVRLLCSILDRLIPVGDNPKLSAQQRSSIQSYSDLITFVEDRPGHDLRYAIDASKITRELGWQPQQDPNEGFEKTVRWYLENEAWWTDMLSGDHQIRRQGLC